MQPKAEMWHMKIIGYFIGHSEATSQDNGSYRSITLNLH